MVDVTDPAAVDSLLQNARDRESSFIILFAQYHFSIQTLSSSANILFIETVSK